MSQKALFTRSKVCLSKTWGAIVKSEEFERRFIFCGECMCADFAFTDIAKDSFVYFKIHRKCIQEVASCEYSYSHLVNSVSLKARMEVFTRHEYGERIGIPSFMTRDTKNAGEIKS